MHMYPFTKLGFQLICIVLVDVSLLTKLDEGTSVEFDLE